MGSLINSIAFLPPKRKLNTRRISKYLITKHNSKIEIIESASFQTEQIILFSHGNAEDIITSYDWCNNYLNNHIKINFIVYEYTGYSNNTKFTPNEEYAYNDIITVYEYLINERKYLPKNIVVLGRSLGSGPSCYLAEKREVGGLIINSGFTSILNVAFSLNFSCFFDIFRNIDRIDYIKCPITIIHSIDDEIVPINHAIELYEKCNQSNIYDPLFIEDCNHNNIDRVCIAFFDHIEKFLYDIYHRSYKLMV